MEPPRRTRLGSSNWSPSHSLLFMSIDRCGAPEADRRKPKLGWFWGRSCPGRTPASPSRLRGQRMSLAPGAASRTRSPRSLELRRRRGRARLRLAARAWPVRPARQAGRRSRPPPILHPRARVSFPAVLRARGSRSRPAGTHRNSCFSAPFLPEEAGHGLGQSCCPVGQRVAVGCRACGGLRLRERDLGALPGDHELGLRLLAVRARGRAACTCRGSGGRSGSGLRRR